MSLQYFKTTGKETKSSEFHKRVAEAAFDAIYPDYEAPEDEETESQQDKFMGDYRAALKKGLSQLSLFVITSGKPLLETDPNSSRCLTRITTTTCFVWECLCLRPLMMLPRLN